MEVVNVRGQFQQLEVAFKTMLGSGEKASKLMNQLVRTAATTPFDLQSVAQGAKQLLAYGTAAEDVNDTLIKLGDIAAGLSLPLGIWCISTERRSHKGECSLRICASLWGEVFRWRRR